MQLPTVARVTHLAQVSALPDQSIIGSSSQYRQQQTCANVRRSVGQHRVSACPGQVGTRLRFLSVEFLSVELATAATESTALSYF